MSRLLVLSYLFYLPATGLSWVTAKKYPEHRPIALLLSFGLASDVLRQALQWWVLGPAYAELHGAPATGWLRVLVHMEQSLFVAWPISLAAVPFKRFLRKPIWWLGLAYLAFELGLVLSYPAVRGQSLQRVYLGWQLACLAVAVGSV